MPNLPGTQLQTPVGALTTVVRSALRWLRQRPFILGPFSWYAATCAPIVIAAGLGLLGVLDWRAAVSLAVLASLPAVPSTTWLRMRRDSDRPIAFVARFGDENSAHAEIAAVHLGEVVRRLARNVVLMENLDLRVLNAPVSDRQAMRILRRTRAVGVVSGRGLLVAGHARWSAWILLRWPQLNRYEDRSPTDGFVALASQFRFTLPSRSETRTDAEFPISKLTAEVFPADHAEAIEATLLVLTARKRAHDAAAPLVHAMPTEVRAVYENGRAMDCLDETGDLVASYRSLEAAGDTVADHPLLWTHCLALITWAEQRDLVSPSERVRVGMRALRVDSENVNANANVGIAYMALNKPDTAIPFLLRALEGEDHPLGQQKLEETLAAAYGMTGDREGEAAALSRAWARTRFGRARVRRKILRHISDAD